VGRSCILVLILLLLSLFGKSDDQLTHTKPLSPGNKLISKGGDFALGFFSKTKSNQSLYLGIWYNNIPERTVVWVANRDSPITAASSTTLAMTNTSDLVLIDSKGLTYWLSKNNITSGTTGVAAVLLNTGNFVLRLSNGTDIWQSFDHPADTILPSMKFLLSYRSNVAERLVAWKGPDDPSSGEFSLSGDPRFPNLQLFTWNMNRPYYRGVLRSLSVSGGTYMSNSSSILYQEAINLGDEFYYKFTISEGSPFTRVILDHTGRLKTLSWNNHSSSWALISASPVAACDIYGSCGPFSYCDLTQVVPTCQCLDGFEPDGLNYRCQRTTMLECGKTHHFVTWPLMKIPDNFLHIRNRSFDQCATECTRNCSCTAYAYANLSSGGAMADPSRCLIWSGELIDIAKGTYGENLYLRLASSSVDKKIPSVKIVLPIIACLLLLACIALFWRYKYRGTLEKDLFFFTHYLSTRVKHMWMSKPVGKWRKKEDLKKLMRGYFNTSNNLEGKNTEFPFVRFEDVLSATNVFADSNLLGRGGFGKVYKMLQNNMCLIG